VALILILGVGWTGATRTIHGWPFACYPTFHNKVGEAMPMLDVKAMDVTGKVHRIKPRLSRLGGDKQRLWGLMWSLVLDKNKERQRAGLESYWRDMARKELVKEKLIEVRFYRAWMSTVPEKRNHIIGRDLLHSLKL